MAELPDELERVLRDVPPPGWDIPRALPWLGILLFWVAVAIVVAVYA